MFNFQSNLLRAVLPLVIFACTQQAYAELTETTQQFILTLSENGYVYPHTEAGNGGAIEKNGLVNWDNKSLSTRTFFYPQQSGKISMGVRLKNATHGTILKISLDSSGKTYEITVNKTDGIITLPVGTFFIRDSRYHFIEISGIHKEGKYFPEIQSIVFSGEAAANLKYNTSPYRGAPSTHLRYEVPKDSVLAWFYTEVVVPVGVNSVNAYYETNGFADGYMGIQVNSPTERRFIFSIWSNYKTDDPSKIPSDYSVSLLKKGKDVFAGEFGKEGSGGHSHLVFPWLSGNTYKLLVGAKPAGDHTIFTAYYFAPENNEWRLIASWDKTKTGGKCLSGLYAFIENFGDNGNDFFKAAYGNQWVCTPAGTWIELTKCSLTTTAGPLKHPRFDYGAGVEDNRFYMFSGGFREMNNLPPHSVIQRNPNAVAPNIDFSSLPIN